MHGQYEIKGWSQSGERSVVCNCQRSVVGMLEMLESQDCWCKLFSLERLRMLVNVEEREIKD